MSHEERNLYTRAFPLRIKAVSPPPGKDLLHLLERVEAAGAGFRSLTESIDTITPGGRMLMQMLGSFAEYERAMVKERTAAGLTAAGAEGRVGGRRPKLTPAQRSDIAENVLSGRRSAAQMARLYAVSQPTVSRILAAYRTLPLGGAADARKHG